MGQFRGEKISARHWRLKYSEKSDAALVMASGTEILDFDVPFTFVLRRVHLTHRDTTKALATNVLDVTLSREKGEVIGIPEAEDVYYKKTDIAASRPIISFEDLGEEGGLIFEAGGHRITLVSATTTDRVTPIIYLKELK